MIAPEDLDQLPARVRVPFSDIGDQAGIQPPTLEEWLLTQIADGAGSAAWQQWAKRMCRRYQIEPGSSRTGSGQEPSVVGSARPTDRSRLRSAS